MPEQNSGKLLKVDQATFIRDRETARKVLFQEVPRAGVVPMCGMIYVNKAVARDAEEIEVIVCVKQ